MSIIIVITSAANLGNSYRLSKMSIIIATIIVIFIVVLITTIILRTIPCWPSPSITLVSSLFLSATVRRNLGVEISLLLLLLLIIVHHCLINWLLALIGKGPPLTNHCKKWIHYEHVNFMIMAKNISSRCKITHPVRDKSMTISIKKTRIAKLIVTPHLGSAVRRTESSLLQVLMKGPHNSQRPSREARDWSSYDIINDIIMMWVWYRSCSKILTKNDRNHLTLQ